MLHFLRDNVVSGICRLTEPDVTFFLARKIVSKAGYVIAKKDPRNQRCDYAHKAKNARRYRFLQAF